MVANFTSCKSFGIMYNNYQLRSNWKRNQVRKPVPQAEAPRQVLQIDTVHYRGAGFSRVLSHHPPGLVSFRTTPAGTVRFQAQYIRGHYPGGGPKNQSDGSHEGAKLPEGLLH